ncbi:MAG: hypothetical protein ACHWZW_21305 [Spirulina sp.]
MCHLLKTTAIASSLVAASFLVGTGMAKAENIGFSGDVPKTCTFSNVAAGTLVLDGFDTLSSTATGGVAGTVDLTCNTAFTLAVAAPVANGAPATGLTLSASTASAGYGANTATVGTPAAALAAVTAQEVTVNMTYTANATIPAANGYAFNVAVTATPD